MIYLNRLFSVVFIVAFTAIVASANFFVIPVKVKMKNLIRVAKSGGDFNDPVKAMESIHDTSDSNRYALYLENDFNLTRPLHVKDYVDIYGNNHGLIGHFGTSDFNHPSAVVYGGDFTHIYNLQIANEGNNSQGYSVALLNDNVTLSLDSVRIFAKNGDINIGMLNKNSANVSGSTVVINLAPCSGNCYAIDTSASSNLSLYRYQIDLYSTDTISSLYGMRVSGLSKVYANNGAITVDGGGVAYGVEMQESALSMANSQLTIDSDKWSYGIYTNLSMLNLAYSVVTAQNASLINTAFYNQASTSTMIDTRLSASVSIDSNMNSTTLLTSINVSGSILKDTNNTYNICAGVTNYVNSYVFNRDCQ